MSLFDYAATYILYWKILEEEEKKKTGCNLNKNSIVPVEMDLWEVTTFLLLLPCFASLFWYQKEVLYRESDDMLKQAREVNASSLKVFKTRLDGALSNLV